MKSALAKSGRLVRQRCSAAAASSPSSFHPIQQVDEVHHHDLLNKNCPTRTTRHQRASLLSTASAAASNEAPRSSSNQHHKKSSHGNHKARLSKLLTREMLKTKREWIPLDDDFRDIKESIESDWAVSYSNSSVTLRCPLKEGHYRNEDGSCPAYMEIACAADDLVREKSEETIKEADGNDNGNGNKPKHQIKVDSSGADAGVLRAEFFPEPPDGDDGKGSVPRVMGVLFRLKLVQPAPPPSGADPQQQQQPSGGGGGGGAIVLDCGMDAGESEVHIFHMHYEYNNSNSNKQNKLELSPRFRRPDQVYAALQTYLARDCGLDEAIGMFLMNYHVFRMQREKLKFLQGVKTFLEQ